MELEFKGVKSEIKEISSTNRTISAYVSKFGNVDYDDDVIVKGAFSKSIKERGPNGSNQIMFLAQHDSWRPLGKPLVLKEDSEGLYAEASIIGTSYGDDYIKLYEAGIINEHSIGFKVLKSNDRESFREITEVKLYEFSAVTWGANEETPFLGWKSFNLNEVNDMQGKIIKQLRNGSLTDDTFMQLEIALSQLTKASFELGKNSVKIVEPPILDTLKDDKNPNIFKGLVSYLEKV